MRRLSLQMRITIVSAMVLIAVITTLTILSVRNAQRTYTNQFEMNLGDDFNMSVNGSRVSIDMGDLPSGTFPADGTDDIMSIDTENSLFSVAGKKFAIESFWIMLFLSLAGIVITYFLVKRALLPVRNLSETIKEINENNLYKKIDEPEAEDEISSLTCSFNEMLNRLNTSFQMQRNFSANTAHELRNPLSTMNVAFQVLEIDENPAIEDYQETIEVIKKSTKRMIQVVDDLFRLSMNEQCDFTDYIDLSKLFHEIEHEMNEKAQTRKVSIVLEKLEGYVKGNETLIYRALFNLVENAVKYNRIGGSVFINCEMKNNQAVIKISDNGIGIPKDALKHIFEPFYRVDKVKSRSLGGTGLGLSIVKDIIDKHKGQIYVNSTEEIGTTFTILFP